MLRRVVDVVEALVGIAVVVTVVLLFTNDPAPAPSSSGEPAAAVDAYGLPLATDSVDASGADAAADGGTVVVEAVDGAAVYSAHCSSCHGSSGGGGLGPALADGRTVERFPDVADQIAFVGAGSGAMPGFAGQLSDSEIAAVVEFLRTDLTSQ